MHLLSSNDGHILTAIRDGLDGARNALLASAFVSSSGIQLLLPNIEALLVRGGLLSLYATFNGGPFTDPQFFKLLGPLEKRFPKQVEVYVYPHATTLFHAKTFLFERVDGIWSGIVGSANLTHTALTGVNFEVSAVAAPIEHHEVVMIRGELNRLRTEGAFRRLTAELCAEICATKKSDDQDPEERERALRQSRARQELVKSALDHMKPTNLPPLPALIEPASVYIENLCATGIGVATDDDLADLAVSVDLGVFVRAGVVAKETTKQIGFVSENTKKGLSFSLVDAGVREKVKAARKSIGKILGSRAVDFGYLRWLPHRLFDDAIAAIASKPDIEAAKAAVARTNPTISEHVEKLRRSLRRDMTKVISTLPLRRKDDWDEEVLRRHDILASVSKDTMRRSIVDYIVERNKTRISDRLVWSQLGRLTFSPRRFEFPLAQTHGDDPSFGHKHFLANLVWACTDRILKRIDEEGGTGALFAYLDARRRLNLGRHMHDASDLAEQAATWLEPIFPLETAVAQFRQTYGHEAFTWELGDLAASFSSLRQ